jgi:hypothetical protein
MFVDSLSDLEKKGWGNGAYYSTLEDFHCVLICRTLSQMYSNAGSVANASSADKSQRFIDQSVSNFASAPPGISDDIEDAEANGPSKGELSEEAHLFAKFTCTYKIEDFLKHEGGGTAMTFPQNEVVQVPTFIRSPPACVDPTRFQRSARSVAETHTLLVTAGGARLLGPQRLLQAL